MENCCRTCLREEQSDSMKLLSSKWNNTVLSFADMLMDIVIMNMEITLDETAFRICSSCELNLITAYNFKIVCQNTEKILAERLTKSIFELLPIEEIKCEDVSRNQDEISNDVFNDVDKNTKHLIDHNDEPNLQSKDCKTRKTKSTSKIRMKREDVKDEEIKLNLSIKNINQEKTMTTSDMPNTENERDNLINRKQGNKNQIRNCRKCNISFEEEKFYRKHVRQTHKNDKKKTNTINRCINNENGSVLKSENGLKTKKQCVYCRKCDVRFEAEKFYRKHCEETHWQSIACTICGKLYLANRIKHHMIIHAKEKTHACIHCGAKFVTNTNLREHLRIHTGERRYKCDYCGETFVHWNSRRNHIVLVHTKEKTYECYICHRKFALNSVMKSHILYHTGDMAHSCPFCVDKRFPTANKLKIHLMTQMHRNVPAEEKEKYINV